jgi:hypothetical protein
MRLTSLLIWLPIVLMTICAPASYGQDAPLPSNYPRILLVQLRCEQTRIAALLKDRQYDAAEEVKQDAAGVQKSLIADFTHNFNYCPVYYYIDSNEELIRKKQFAGVLMNADGSAAANLPIGNGSNDYGIVYYGYYISQPKSGKMVKDDSKYTADPTVGKGLVLLNDRFEQVSYVYALGYSDAMSKKTSAPEKYESKHFDIGYFPLAKLLNKALNADRGEHGEIKTLKYRYN